MTFKEELKLAQSFGLDIKFLINAKLDAAYSSIDWSTPKYQSPREMVVGISKSIREFNILLSHFKTSALQHPENSWYLYADINGCHDEIKKLKRKILIIKNDPTIKTARVSYDLEKIKQIPLNTITEILPSGFFVNNPFRTEKSPSNSLHWDRKTNRWFDFGSSQSGDVIDLFMAINKCSMIEALKYLSTTDS